MSEDHGRLGGKSKQRTALLLLLLLFLCLRLIPLRHGLPRNYLREATFSHAALLMLRDRDPVLGPGVNGREPLLLPYLMVPVFAGQYVLGRTLGWWADTQEYSEELVQNQGTERLPARLLVSILGVASAWVLFRFLRDAGLREGAWIGAWLLGTGLLHLQLSVQDRAWVPMLLFYGLTAWAAAAHVRDGRSSKLLLACALAALAQSTLAMPMGRVILGVCGIAWYVAPNGWRGAALRRRFRDAALGIVLFTVMELVLGFPWLLKEDAIGIILQGLKLGSWTFFFQGEFLFGGRGIFSTMRWASFEVQGRALFGYDPVLVVLGVLGVVAAFRQRILWPVMIFTVLWTLSLLFHRNGHVFYLSPLVLFLVVPAAFAAQTLWRMPVLRWGLVPLLAFPLVQAARFVHVLSQRDTRDLAEDRLRELPAGAAVGIDRFGPQPELNLQALERLEELRRRRGSELTGRQTRRRKGLLDGTQPRQGLDVLPLGEVLVVHQGGLAGLAGRARRRHAYRELLAGREATYRVWSGGRSTDLVWPGGLYEPREGMGEYGPHAGGILSSLGVEYLLLVDLQPGFHGSHVLDPLTGGDDPLWTLAPGPDGAEIPEARLPFELEFAATNIWRVQRPGPLLRLYRLR